MDDRKIWSRMRSGKGLTSDALPEMWTRVRQPDRPSGRPGGRRGKGREGLCRGRPTQRGGAEAGMEKAQGTGEAKWGKEYHANHGLPILGELGNIINRMSKIKEQS